MHFRLDFGIVRRWSKDFDLASIPCRSTQEEMVGLYYYDPEIKELWDKYGLTDFELILDRKCLDN